MDPVPRSAAALTLLDPWGVLVKGVVVADGDVVGGGRDSAQGVHDGAAHGVGTPGVGDDDFDVTEGCSRVRAGEQKVGELVENCLLETRRKEC